MKRVGSNIRGFVSGSAGTLEGSRVLDRWLWFRDQQKRMESPGRCRIQRVIRTEEQEDRKAETSEY